MFLFNSHSRHKLICVGITKVILNLMVLYCANLREINLFTGIALHTYTARIADCICKHAVNMTIQGQAVYVYCTLISVHFCL